MRHITVLNKTKDKIVIQYDEYQHTVDVNCQETLCIDDNVRLRIYKKKSLCRLCLGQIFLHGIAKNMWIFGPVILLNYDSFICPPKGIRQIEITETTEKRFLFFIYNLLLFNANKADEYDYHNIHFKRKVRKYSIVFMIPFFIISFLLISASLYGMIYDFSLESIIVLLLCAIPIAVTIALTGDRMGFLNVERSPIKKSKHQDVSILKDIGWFIKCADNS